ncbi:MAG: Asp-tRNA(Asn)/Glu-tRNA(Gln) amidotransferase subunit GatB [Candidatus Omnitrophica bacterium]|nr:Asp-tRNA(Asn)/Glu-tRNA(Gln) amidotransferase subunit GatB [Candidatus Omnitrophota bacterium]
MNYETVIGLEVHVQLKTDTKLFCGCGTKFGKAPNTQACPVCLGFPGVLPVINKKALFLSIKTGLALGCSISKLTRFDRKHYYYPDLPKNFQISQYDRPLSQNGFLEFETEGKVKTVPLKRIHLEEDAGKLIHQENTNSSLVDYNRSGMPLMEIVTQPEIYSPQEAYDFLINLRSILEYIEVSDCNMEEGSLRCDANISLRPEGQSELGTKTELKNMNSFKAVRQALECEVERQTEALGDAKTIAQETRLWDSESAVTVSMRSKEEAHDYRYFPEPDLMPFLPSEALITELRESLPEMPRERRARFISEYGLSAYDAAVLTADKKLADFFEDTIKSYKNAKTAVNWIMGDLTASLTATSLSISAVSFKPKDFAEMLSMIESGKISGKMAKEVLKEAVEKGKNPAEIVKSKGLSQITDEAAISAAVEKAIAANQSVVADFKSGKDAALTFLVGQIMKETKGRANPKLAGELLRKRLAGGAG